MGTTTLDKVAYTLLVIGGLNWGLIGFFEYSLVDEIFSVDIARVIYAIVGVAAVYGVFSIVKMRATLAGAKTKS